MWRKAGSGSVRRENEEDMRMVGEMKRGSSEVVKALVFGKDFRCIF